MFERAREKHKDDEYKILIAKVIDKYEFSKNKNKIMYTDFLNISEISVIKKMLEEEKVKNFIIYGGKEDTDRSIIIFYPEKLSIEMVEKNYNNIFKIIRIKLPNGITMEHREYLSGIMKLGIKREKFGDILVFDDGADIISLSEISETLKNDLILLTRFKKSEITIESISNVRNDIKEFEEKKIIVSSIRLDNFVAEIANCSRTKSEEIIKEGKVYLNSINEYKTSKKINLNDIITIRGKGKYIFEQVEKETRSGRQIILLKKYK